MILLMSLFYLLALFIISVALIYIIEKEVAFTHVLLMNALLIVALVGFGFDGFFMIFAIIDVSLALYLQRSREQA